jgi:hypothetical protein
MTPDCVGSNTPDAGSLPDESDRLESRSRGWQIASFILPDVAAVPFLFTVDAAAVRLPVHPDLFRNPDPFGPAFAEIPIEEGNPLLFGHTFGNLPDEIVLLIAAVEDSRCKGVEPILFRNPRGMGKPEMIAVPATFFLPENNLS